ncbi:MAG: glycosyltransferase family 2 protein, partial [Methanosphaera sp.]
MVEISVIIPVFNSEEFLNKCLDSLLNQSFTDIEIICVDDGSTDNSLKILKSYANKDDRVRVFTQENNGAGAARNLGLKYVNG